MAEEAPSFRGSREVEESPLFSSKRSPSYGTPGRHRRGHSASILQVTIDPEGEAVFEEVEVTQDELLDDLENAGCCRKCFRCDCHANDLKYNITLGILIMLTLAAFVHAFYMEITKFTNGSKAA